MIVIRCHECKRKYNWAGDAFCPHCGAFNQAEDYGFDREPIEAEVGELDRPKKTVFTPKPPEERRFQEIKPPVSAQTRPRVSAQEKTSSATQQQAQAKGCLRKIIIAVVVWNVAMVLLSVLMGVISNLIF